VLERFRAWGPTVILSDGDAVFQPRKIERSGLQEAVDGNVLIYIHKEHELDDVERRYPADHYVLVDDKLRILTAVKRGWEGRVTTRGRPDDRAHRDLLAYDLAASSPLGLGPHGLRLSGPPARPDSAAVRISHA